MSTSHGPDRTRMFARVLGPYFVIVIAVAVVRAPNMPALLAQFTADPVWPWVMGALVLLCGLAIVAFHQVWRGAAAIIVSVLGWLLVVRGLVLLVSPDLFETVADRAIGTTGVWQVIYIATALVALYLTYVGWRPITGEHHSNDIDAPKAHPPAG
ncbi:hypothetical protein L2K20_09780 [Mycobacterium sp. MBM]|nr:hypothetical protein [Mycobacterium sp. MBM]